jgi:Fis family transcriptional regulator
MTNPQPARLLLAPSALQGGDSHAGCPMTHTTKQAGASGVNTSAFPQTGGDASSSTALRDVVASSVRRYLHDLDDHPADDLYEVVLREVEAPLLREVLRHCDGNQSRAAATLGLNRATLRKKLRDHGLL